MPPDLVQQLFTGEQAAVIDDERVSSFELQRADLEPIPTAPDLAAPEIDFTARECKRRRAGCRDAAAQQSTNPRAQFVRAERLGDVVVLTRLEGP